MSRSDGDNMTLESLQEEHQNLQKSLETMVFEMWRLRLPLRKRFLIMTDKFFSSKFGILKSFILKKQISKNSNYSIGRTTGNQSPPPTEQAQTNMIFAVSQPPPPTTEQAQANVVTVSQSPIPSTTVTASSESNQFSSRHAVPVSPAYLNCDRELPVMPGASDSH